MHLRQRLSQERPGSARWECHRPPWRGAVKGHISFSTLGCMKSTPQRTPKAGVSSGVPLGVSETTAQSAISLLPMNNADTLVQTAWKLLGPTVSNQHYYQFISSHTQGSVSSSSISNFSGMVLANPRPVGINPICRGTQ